MVVLVAILLVVIANLLAMYEVNLLFLFVTETAYARERTLYLDLTTSSSVMRRTRFRVQRARLRFWIRPGRTRAWWDSFVTNLVLPEELMDREL